MLDRNRALKRTEIDEIDGQGRRWVKRDEQKRWRT
jgi:hypothetical protein